MDYKMSSNINLTEDEKDCLQELMNVAYGSATAAISEILDAFAKLSIPKIQIINASDLKNYLSDELKLNEENFTMLLLLQPSAIIIPAPNKAPPTPRKTPTYRDWETDRKSVV